ncbi:MAG: hypothetical protein K0B11_18610 [Mariniphaga sp.]|nr:hypothetical protein [Mariniphaga sp.]
MFFALSFLADVIQKDENCRQITGANDLAVISYAITGGWEKFDFEGIRPYCSSESHFDSSVVILNANSVFGYFSHQENVPFRINIKKPKEFYGATSLPRAKPRWRGFAIRVLFLSHPFLQFSGFYNSITVR